jgi:hypothetical protein
VVLLGDGRTLRRWTLVEEIRLSGCALEGDIEIPVPFFASWLSYGNHTSSTMPSSHGGTTGLK